jgi:hypothetical protein
MEVTVRRARGRPVDRLTSAAAHWVPHALKTANNILSVIEIAFYALTFAIWASLGFPAFKTVAACGLLIIVGVIAYRSIASRQP